MWRSDEVMWQRSVHVLVNLFVSSIEYRIIRVEKIVGKSFFDKNKAFDTVNHFQFTPVRRVVTDERYLNQAVRPTLDVVGAWDNQKNTLDVFRRLAYIPATDRLQNDNTGSCRAIRFGRLSFEMRSFKRNSKVSVSEEVRWKGKSNFKKIVDEITLQY